MRTLLALILALPILAFAQSEKLRADADCRQEVGNYISGARAFLHGAPEQFKSVSKLEAQAHIIEHSPMPSDAMYILEMDAWGPQDPEELAKVQGEMLKGYRDGKKYTDHTNWQTVGQHMHEACMSRVGT